MASHGITKYSSCKKVKQNLCKWIVMPRSRHWFSYCHAKRQLSSAHRHDTISIEICDCCKHLFHFLSRSILVEFAFQSVCLRLPLSGVKSTMCGVFNLNIKITAEMNETAMNCFVNKIPRKIYLTVFSDVKEWQFRTILSIRAKKSRALEVWLCSAIAWKP